ncbi:MAG: cobaltochelatase subunit CobN, partial [Acidimicrobiales bacterium]
MILVLTNADTEILSLRTLVEGLPDGFPPVVARNPSLLASAPPLDGVDVVLVRLLGGRRAWEEPFDTLAADAARRGVPLLCFGGESVPDADLMARSTVAPALVAAALAYWTHGGVGNLEQLLRFVADTVLLTGFGFEVAEPVPSAGVHGARTRHAGRP